MKLRWYQEETISLARKCFAGGKKRVIVVKPTGAGKTITACEIINLALQKGKIVTILVHRVEILFQFYRSLSLFGIQPNLIFSHHRIIGQINLGMVETYYKRFPNGLDEDFLVIDEVHFGNFEKVLQKTKSRVLALTATPVPSRTTYKLNQNFDDIICPVNISQLISEKHLLKGKTYSANHDFSHVPKKGRDFDPKALMKEFQSPKLYTGALQNYEKLCPNDKAICYNVNVEESLRYCEMFNEAGHKSEHVDGKTDPGERKRILERFEEGETKILHNVGIATTGYDEPSVRCIIENFATTSLSKQHQCVGRGARPFEDDEEFTIIDMGTNYHRHGQFGDDVNWEEIFNNPKLDQKKKSQIPKMECEGCGAIISVEINCPYCNYEISEEKAEEIIEETLSAKEIKQRKLETLPLEIKGIPLGKMDKEQLVLYSKHMNYSPKWVNIRLAHRSKSRWRR